MNSPLIFNFYNLFTFGCLFINIKKIYQVFLKLERHYHQRVFLMAKKKSSKKGISIPVRTDVSSVEAETIKRADHTIAVIEDFLGKWESSRIKNKVMVPQIDRIKKFHKELIRWKNDAMESKGNDESKLKRLHDFVLICKNYS